MSVEGWKDRQAGHDDSNELLGGAAFVLSAYLYLTCLRDGEVMCILYEKDDNYDDGLIWAFSIDSLIGQPGNAGKHTAIKFVSLLRTPTSVTMEHHRLQKSDCEHRGKSPLLF